MEKEAIKEKEEKIGEIENNQSEKKSDIIKTENSSKGTDKKKTKKIIIISIISVIILIGLVLSTIFAIMNMNNTKIIFGASINGIDVSNLTKEEAKQKLNNLFHDEKERNINLKYQDYEVTVIPEQMEAQFDIETSVEKVYQIGRNSNVFVNNFNIIKCNLLKTNIEMPININDEKLKEIVNNIQSNIPGGVIESTYSIEGENLIISKGKKGIAVNYDELKKLIINNIKNVEDNKQTIEIPTQEKEAENINIEKIYDEIHTEAKDAYYTSEPFQIYPHVVGVDFNISMEEAKKMLEQDLEQYTIPLKITVPDITTDKLGTKAFPDLLGSYTTYYSSSSSNRKYNIAKAARAINGKTLLPGEVFSYNKTIGNPSQANGYRLATGFANGKSVDSYGGGVCQVSSTLYNSVLYANLEIISRYNHSLPVGYVPPSRDATVYYGGVDFKFKNDRKYPIKIVATANGSALKIVIYGVKEENEYEVSIESWITDRISCRTIYTDNPNMEQGTEKVITKGSNGYKSVAYKIVKLNGNVISKTLLSSDTYNPENREVERGTKNSYVPPAQPNPTPEEPEAPTEPETPQQPEETQPPVSNNNTEEQPNDI